MLGVKFRLKESRVAETVKPGISPLILVKELAEEKAMAVAKGLKDEVVIGADTLVIVGNKILGKPKSLKEAEKMLKMLSGKKHKVVTAYTIFDAKTKRKFSRAVKTEVIFRKLTAQEIKKYAKKESMGKCGGYGLQGLGSLLVKEIKGDYYNVIGLPINNIFEDLKKFDVKIF